MKTPHRILTAALLGMVAWAGEALAAVGVCPGSALVTAKRSRLFLYFPTADDATYPEHGTTGVATSPLRLFDAANLSATAGTTAQLSQRIFEFVTEDYCEFDVKVEKFTTMPPQTDPRWQIVGIGSDGSGTGLFGEAQAVDTSNADPQDFARVWANTFGQQFGGAGGALNGANSTLERWATAIAHTAAHEAAHNYGAAHGDSAPRTGTAEDAQNNHIMATGSTGLTGEMRAGRNRHFGDREYEILAHNVGLNIETLWNWDFTNTNNTNANKLRLRVLGTPASLTIAWFYTGSTSPWTNPTITGTGGTQSFQGTTFNVYDLEFSAPKAWSGGANGVVPPATKFHVGASFAETGTFIILDGKLFNGATQLPLFPRLFGFDAGTADLDTGDFNVRIFNLSAEQGPLLLRRLELIRLPRMIDINSMVTNGRPTGINGLRVQPLARKTLLEQGRSVRESTAVSIGKLSEKRSVDILYGPRNCPAGSIGSTRAVGPGDTAVGELKYCLKGNALSLFPATYSYLIATVVEPHAKQWNKAAGRFVTAPLEHRVFYQLAGFVPDFNRNGVDDLIDIRTKKARDENRNGIPDDVERHGSVDPRGKEYRR